MAQDMSRLDKPPSEPQNSILYEVGKVKITYVDFSRMSAHIISLTRVWTANG